MLRRNREVQAACPLLVAALDLAHCHGAAPLAERAREERRELGLFLKKVLDASIV